MSRPFNFYQGTGFPVGPNVPTNITDFFTGFFTPEAIAKGEGAGFRFFASSEKSFWELDFSGNINGAIKEDANIQSSYRGFFTPLCKESGFLGLGISGDIAFCQTDVVGLPINFSGEVASGKRDDCNIFLNLNSGDIVSGYFDLSSLSSSFSGRATGETIDYPYLYCSFRGGFTAGNDYNETAISFELSSITFDYGIYKLVTGFETGVNINFYLSSIEYNTNFV